MVIEIIFMDTKIQKFLRAYVSFEPRIRLITLNN